METAATYGMMTGYGLDVPAHLTHDDPIPVLDTLQAQGDVYIIPAHMAQPNEDPGELIPPDGLTVVEGTNTHTLAGDGLWSPGGHAFGDVGTLTVPDGGTAFLFHSEEHGANGIAPGVYVVRRQREQATEQRLVAD